MRELWDRASLEMKTRPIKVTRDITRKDLLIPKGPSKPRMLAMTFVGGIAMALLYVWPPLMVIALVSSVGMTAALFWGVVGGAAVVCWATLFTLAVRESAAHRRYAEQLRSPS